MERASRLTEAICLAARAHYGQTDKAGEPYILHPLRIMQAVSPRARVVAVLHDVVEESPLHLSDLKNHAHLTPEQVVALGYLTRHPAVEYADYIADLASDEIAREVKIADLRDNLSRPASLPDSLRKRYEKALRTLQADARAYHLLTRGS